MAKKNQVMQLTNKFYIEYMHTYICVGIYILTPEMKNIAYKEKTSVEKTSPQNYSKYK